MAGGRDASQSDFGGSSSSGGYGGGGGGRDASQPDFSPPSSPSSNNGGGRDPTKQYENLPKDYNLETDNPDAYKALAEQRKQARYAISPMTDPKNIALATGLNILLGPLAGNVYSRYKNASAMGFSPTISNMLGFDVGDLSGLLKGGGTTTPPITNNGGEGNQDNFNISSIIAAAPSIIQGNTQKPSVAAAWYKNLGTTSGWDPFSTNSLFANARAKQQSILGTATGIGQMAVNESPFFNFLKDNSINKGIL